MEAETITVEAQDFLVHQGDASGPMFIVKDGKLRVSVKQGDEQRELAFLRKGDVFGELSIARGQRRQATVQALTRCRLVKIDERTFGKLYARFPQFKNTIEERIAGYSQKKTARLPLDFLQEILPANAETKEQVSLKQLDQKSTATDLGPFATSDGLFVKRRNGHKRFPHIRQIDQMDCGAASLAMVCRYFGRKVSVTRIRQKVRTATDGTSLRGLCDGAVSLGLAARSVKASKNNVGQMPLPASYTGMTITGSYCSK